MTNNSPVRLWTPVTRDRKRFIEAASREVEAHLRSKPDDEHDEHDDNDEFLLAEIAGFQATAWTLRQVRVADYC